MNDPTPAPVASSADGSWLVIGDGPELLVYRGSGQPAWKAFCDGVIVAVGITSTSVIAADSDGRVTWFRLHDGRPEETSRGAAVVAAAFAPSGVGAGAQVGGGIAIAVPGRPHQPLPAPAGAVIAFGPAGESLALGGLDGVVQAMDPSTGRSWGQVELGAPARGITWSAPDRWVVTTPSALVGLASDASRVSFTIAVPTDADPSRPDGAASLGAVACSSDGLVAACVLGARRVAVFELHDRRFLGTIDLRRPVGGVAFGGATVLAIALDDGDLSLVDLGTGTSWRTEPHPGRGRSTWNLDLRVDLGGIRGARAKARAGGAPVATYTGWRPEDDEKRGGVWAACLSCLTGCGCLVGSVAAGMLVMAALRSSGVF